MDYVIIYTLLNVVPRLGTYWVKVKMWFLFMYPTAGIFASIWTLLVHDRRLSTALLFNRFNNILTKIVFGLIKYYNYILIIKAFIIYRSKLWWSYFSHILSHIPIFFFIIYIITLLGMLVMLNILYWACFKLNKCSKFFIIIVLRKYNEYNSI